MGDGVNNEREELNIYICIVSISCLSSWLFIAIIGTIFLDDLLSTRNNSQDQGQHDRYGYYGHGHCYILWTWV